MVTRQLQTLALLGACALSCLMAAAPGYAVFVHGHRHGGNSSQVDPGFELEQRIRAVLETAGFVDGDHIISVGSGNDVNGNGSYRDEIEDVLRNQIEARLNDSSSSFGPASVYVFFIGPSSPGNFFINGIFPSQEVLTRGDIRAIIADLHGDISNVDAQSPLRLVTFFACNYADSFMPAGFYSFDKSFRKLALIGSCRGRQQVLWDPIDPARPPQGDVFLAEFFRRIGQFGRSPDDLRGYDALSAFRVARDIARKWSLHFGTAFKTERAGQDAVLRMGPEANLSNLIIGDIPEGLPPVTSGYPNAYYGAHAFDVILDSDPNVGQPTELPVLQVRFPLDSVNEFGGRIAGVRIHIRPPVNQFGPAGGVYSRDEQADFIFEVEAYDGASQGQPDDVSVRMWDQFVIDLSNPPGSMTGNFGGFVEPGRYKCFAVGYDEQGLPITGLAPFVVHRREGDLKDPYTQRPLILAPQLGDIDNWGDIQVGDLDPNDPLVFPWAALSRSQLDAVLETYGSDDVFFLLQIRQWLGGSNLGAMIYSQHIRDNRGNIVLPSDLLAPYVVEGVSGYAWRVIGCTVNGHFATSPWQTFQMLQDVGTGPGIFLGSGIAYIFGGVYEDGTANLILQDPADGFDVTIDAVSADTLSQGTYLDTLGTSGVSIGNVTASAAGFNSGSSTNINIVAGGMHQEDFYLTPLSTVTLSLGDTSTFAEGETREVTIDLGSPAGADYAFTVASSNTDAFTVSTSSVDILTGNQTAKFNVTAVDDTVYRGGADSAAIISVSGSPGSDDVALLVAEEESGQLTVSFNASEISENGGSTSANIGFGGATLPVNVSGIVVDSADTGEVTVSTPVTLLAGNTSVSAALTAVDDSLVDGYQDVTITASHASYTSGNNSIRILDDDWATVGWKLGSTASAAEDDATYTAEVELSISPGASLTNSISFSISATAGTATETSDYTFTPPGTITFLSSSVDRASTSVDVNLVDDSALEGDETVVLDLISLDANGVDSVSFGTSQQTLTITDSDVSRQLTLAVTPGDALDPNTEADVDVAPGPYQLDDTSGAVDAISPYAAELEATIDFAIGVGGGS